MDSTKVIKIDKGILKDTLKIAWPAMVESFFIALAAFVDTLMVSTLGESAVGSVGLTTQPKMIALAMFFAVGVATSAAVARRYGEGRRDDANRILATSLTFTVVGSIIVGILFVVGADFVIKVFQSNETNHDGAVEYLKIVVGAMVFNCVQIVINSALRGAGNTKITMYTNIISNTVNVIFNYLLIGGKLGFPALGIKGAAIATVLGTVVSSTISIISLIPKDRFLNIGFIIKNKIKPSLSSFGIIVKFGYGVFIEQVLLRFGFSATVIMASSLNFVSVHQVGMNIVMISFAAGDGLQAAAVALIGRSLGRKEPELAKTYGRCCQLIGLAISVIYAILFFTLGSAIMNMFFPSDPDIAAVGTKIVFVIVPIVLFQISQVIFMGALRGAGDTLYTAIVSAFSVTVVRTAVSYLLAYTFSLGIVGVWLGMLADQLFRLIVSSIRFKRGKWVHIKM